MKRVQGTHLGVDTVRCLVVESSRGKKEESVREKDINLSAEKESLKGSRKDRQLKRARKKSGKNDILSVEQKESLQGSRSGKLSRRSQRVIPNLCLWGITSSSLKRTPVLAAGFQLEGNLSHFDQLHNITQRLIPPVPGGQRERNCAFAFLCRYKRSSC